jgi:hypothetical protein
VSVRLSIISILEVRGWTEGPYLLTTRHPIGSTKLLPPDHIPHTIERHEIAL